MKLSEPPHRGERLVMRRFTQYVVYLARGLVGSPGIDPKAAPPTLSRSRPGPAYSLGVGAGTRIRVRSESLVP